MIRFRLLLRVLLIVSCVHWSLALQIDSSAQYVNNDKSPPHSSERADNADRRHPIEDIRVFAILKLSCKQRGDSSLEGGVCGTGFFIGPSTAITAHHVLNEATFTPNVGFRHCQLWILTRQGTVYPLERGSTKAYPEIDTTVIQLPGANPQSIWTDRFKTRDVSPGSIVRGIGHVGNAMPAIKGEWHGETLHLRKVNLSSVLSDQRGHVKRILRLTVNANDIRFRDVAGFELSFGSRVGMSGGPVIDEQTGCVIGMLSLGLPPDSEIKNQTFAVSIDQIMQVILH